MALNTRLGPANLIIGPPILNDINLSYIFLIPGKPKHFFSNGSLSCLSELFYSRSKANYKIWIGTSTGHGMLGV